MAQATARGMALRDDIAGLEETTSAELNPAAAAAREQAEIQAAYIMAKRFPRDEEKAREAIIKSCKRLSFASEAYYLFPRGGNDVSGPSVVLAREAGRLWHNLRSGLKVIRDDSEARLIKGWALDAETNYYVEAEDEFKKLIQRKKDNTTIWVTPDERDLRELTFRRGAILIRNSILSTMPKDIIDIAVAGAQETVAEFADKDKAQTAKLILETFSTLFVTQAEIEGYLGNPMSEITKEQIVKLRGIAAAMRSGVTKKEEFFSGAAKPSTETGNLNLGNMKTGDPKDYDNHQSNAEQTGGQKQSGDSKTQASQTAGAKKRMF